MRLAALLIALALVAGLGACGGSDERANAYVGAVNQAQERFATTFDRLSQQISSTSTASEDRRTLAAFSDAVDRAVADLRAIEAPSEVRAEHDRLIAEIAGYGRQIERAQDAVVSTDRERILAARTDLVTAVAAVSARIDGTVRAINRKLRG